MPLFPRLELGRLVAIGEVSRLVVLAREYVWVGGLNGPEEPWPLRLLATESTRFSPAAAGWALHRLLTLSDRFIMALCTKPPRPFVGEIDLSILSGEIRPDVGDIVTLRPRARVSSRAAVSIEGGSNLCAAVTGSGEVILCAVGRTDGLSIEPDWVVLTLPGRPECIGDSGGDCAELRGGRKGP
jgi:hypothetical protein